MNAVHSKQPASHQRKVVQFKSLAVAFTLLAGAVTTLAVYAAGDIPFVVSAYEAASKSASSSRVSTDITLKKGAATLATASGKLTKQGDLLVGTLPLTVSVPAIANKGTHTLNFSLSKSGRVGLQWLLNGQPFNGIEMKYFDADVTGSTLTKSVTLQGMNLDLTVALKKGFVFVPGGVIIRSGKTASPIFKGGIEMKPVIKATPTPRPMIIMSKPLKLATPTPKPQVAYGRYITIKARFVVDNSSDGLGDHNVELVGRVTLGGRIIFDFNQKKMSAGESYQAKPITIIDEYGDSRISKVLLDGKIEDYDKTSSNDMMWTASKIVDIRALAEASNEYTYSGDRKSESGTVYLTALKGDEVFRDAKSL